MGASRKTRAAQKLNQGKKWWPETGLNRDAGLFRALISNICNYVHDLHGRRNTPKYM